MQIFKFRSITREGNYNLQPSLLRNYYLRKHLSIHKTWCKVSVVCRVCIWSVTIQLNWLQFGPIIWDKTSIGGEIPNTINVSLIFSSNFLLDVVGERKENVIWGLMRSIKSTMAVSSLKFSQPEMSLFRLFSCKQRVWILREFQCGDYHELKLIKITSVFVFPFKLHEDWKRNYKLVHVIVMITTDLSWPWHASLTWSCQEVLSLSALTHLTLSRDRNRNVIFGITWDIEISLAIMAEQRCEQPSPYDNVMRTHHLAQRC